MEIPIPYGDNPANAKFKMCECRQGKPQDCGTYYCEGGYSGVSICEKQSVVRGEGCPSCGECCLIV